MRRLKSIDIFRGICMLYMVVAHLSRWWLQSQFLPQVNFFYIFIEPFGASGFLFISGLSVALSMNKKYIKSKIINSFDFKRVRYEYFFKAGILLVIALGYNLILGIVSGDFSMIWSWFILLTASICLFLAYPLLKLSNFWRIGIAILIIFANQVILPSILPFQGGTTFFGIIFYIFYNGYSLSPILSFFPFFLFGTVIGDLIYNNILSDSQDSSEINRKRKKRNIYVGLLLTGFLLTVVGTLLFFPNFILRQTVSWIIHSLGLEILLITVLLMVEDYKLINIKGNYKFFFYYSYYSLTVYLGHNILALLFWNQLNLYNVWPILFLTVLGLTYFLKFSYQWKPDLISLKFYIGTMSNFLAKFVEEKKPVLKVYQSSSTEVNL